MHMIDETKKLLSNFDPTFQKPRDPNYIFVANSNRCYVLTDQLEALGLSYKTFKHSREPTKKTMVLVYFTDKLLNKQAEKDGLRISLQDMSQTLPFKDAGSSQFQRFRSAELIGLIMKTYKNEFNVATLVENQVIYDHFMTHTSKKEEIVESILNWKWKLIRSMLSFSERFLDNLEPINLVSDYYGAKYAFYLAFLLHHIAWLIPPAIVGSLLFFMQVYLTFKDQVEGQSFIQSYTEAVDNVWNFPYIIFITLWSTFYVESWKRKEASIGYMWGLEERREQIMSSTKVQQENSEYIFNSEKGKREKVVRGRNECCIALGSYMLLFLFTAITLVTQMFIINLRDYKLFGEEEADIQNWDIVSVLLYAIIISIFSSFVPGLASYIMKRENCSSDSDQEASLTKNLVLLTSVIAYTGLFFLAYIIRSYSQLNWLMLFMYTFQKIIPELYKYWSPYRTMPAMFEASAKKFKPHFRKFPDDYEEFSSRQLHIDAEQQTMMRDKTESNTASYNDILLEFGWINLFAPVFPASALVGVFTNLLKVNQERDIIGKFNKRGRPKAAIDIGGMLEYFEFFAVIGTINSVGIVIFTSTHLSTFAQYFGDYTDTQMVIGVFILENFFIAFRFLVAALIPDYPQWVEDDKENMRNRVKQVKKIIDEKVVEHMMIDENAPPKTKKTIASDDSTIKSTVPTPDADVDTCTSVELLEAALESLHSDRDLSSLLIEKLKIGCENFMQVLEDQDDDEISMDRIRNTAFKHENAKRVVNQPKANKGEVKKILRKKMKTLRSLQEMQKEEQDAGSNEGSLARIEEDALSESLLK